MLLDWVTARIPGELLTPEAREKARCLGDRVCCYCPKTGDVRYESPTWESIRSDSHQITTRFTSDLWVQGSPARCFGDGDAVFGSGGSSALDLLQCVRRMVECLATRLDVRFPAAEHWIVSRVDVTANLQLASLSEVVQSLTILRNIEGGRYRVSQTNGDTVYWSNRSKMRSGKAYAKGPHLKHLMKQSGYTGRVYTADEIAAANNLLRLELKLGREWFARHEWKALSPANIRAEWESYFGRMIGGAELVSDADVQKNVLAAAPTEGRGRAAYGCWLMIKSEGWDKARHCYSRTSWYRHLEILRAAGLRDADISAGQVVPLRRRIMEAQMVTSWHQLRAA